MNVLRAANIVLWFTFFNFDTIEFYRFILKYFFHCGRRDGQKEDLENGIGKIEV